ncbi:MAG: (2Fe-2S)-binding protein [Actinomycetota bacterium]
MMVNPGDSTRVELTVNGVSHQVDVEARWLLSDVLRHEIGLTGTHVGCEHGVCGCCTVLLDGQPARSCLTLAVQADGSEITTVEGLASEDGELHPLQESFMTHHGLQCGYCTPGFLIGALPLYERAADMSDEELRKAISGQLCRCTGYAGILAAIRGAAEIERGRAKEDDA